MDVCLAEIKRYLSIKATYALSNAWIHPCCFWNKVQCNEVLKNCT